MLNLVNSLVRTNAFIHDKGVRIALKIDCKQITNMPEPRPMFEIFVNSPEIEGVHLRAGKVARGGLRWSERTEDYRTEVLGLMKTQRVKNSIIIPLGAKGGFVVKKRSSDRGEMFELVKSAYKEFIRSLLEISDNMLGLDVINPDKVIAYDEKDPYLVVAADKGTATFSDVANKVATEEFCFWLGDAFASGGSNGYDHKLYGITARGAWEAATHHFRSINIDPQKDEFTAIGIGDMSGDVFGNGMLLSDSMKLVAAFNHKHIFIDPTPNPKKSFKERKRLFETPGSEWKDFNQSIISKGGGVFERSQKEITLSKAASKALGLTGDSNTFSGDELVKTILKAPVDLFWNGGIGTYVKAKSETNLDVGDPSNDDVRIDADELKAKIVGEGGNLGFTQLARVEYSKHHGLLNTDAVDNSAGVDLSDQEVNFKILLDQPIRDNKLDVTERNKVLENFAEEFCDRVLAHNKSQNMAIGLATLRSRKNLELYKKLIDFFETELNLDRAGEVLPDDESLTIRSNIGAGLTRPECAVVLAYAKMWVFNSILNSDIPKDPALEKWLYGYFPKPIATRFKEYVPTHPLKNEIIATEVANYIVDLLGASNLFQLSKEAARPIDEIISACILVIELWGAQDLTKELRELNSPSNLEAHYFALNSISEMLSELVLWALEHTSLKEGIGAASNTLTESILALKTYSEKTDNQLPYPKLLDSLPEELKNSISAILTAKQSITALEISKTTGKKISSSNEIYQKFSELTGLNQLIEKVRSEIDDETSEAERLVKIDLIKRINNSTIEILSSLVKRYPDQNHLRQLERKAFQLKSLKRNILKISSQNIDSSELYLLAKEIDSIQL